MADVGDTEGLAALRARFAATVTAGVADPRIEQAFAATRRERFAGPPPWFTPVSGRVRRRYLRAPDDDPAFLYQDRLIALDRRRGINIGEPSLHARLLDAVAPAVGEVVVQVGAGSGYYTSMLAYLVGAAGRVQAFEVDAGLAARAARNLAEQDRVTVHCRSGTAGGLPAADVVYVNAGITQPCPAWLAALRPGGRLIFPLQPEHGFGGMLLVQKPLACDARWPARFVCRAGFIACQGKQVAATGQGLAAAFAGDGWQAVRSFRVTDAPDDSCWFDGGGWWLSLAEA